MHNIAKKVIEIYLNEKKIPTLDELGISGHNDLKTKNLSFVTLYKDGSVIASSGRINLKKPNTISELIENTLFCLKDPRFIGMEKLLEEISKLETEEEIIDDFTEDFKLSGWRIFKWAVQKI